MNLCMYEQMDTQLQRKEIRVIPIEESDWVKGRRMAW